MATDSFGRDAGNIDARSMMQSLSGKVSQILETKDTNAEAALARVVDAVNEVAAKIDANFQRDEQSASNWFKSIIDCFTKTKTSQSKENKNQYKNESSDVRIIRKAVQQIRNMGASPNTFWVGLGHFSARGMSQLKQVLVDCGVCGSGDAIIDQMKENGAATTGGSTGSTSTVEAAAEAIGDGADMGGPTDAGHQKFLKNLGNFTVIAAGMIAKLGDMFELNLTDAFKGVLKDSNRFRENLRATIFQTQGYSETFRGMEKDFMNVSQATRASGVEAAKFDEVWNKNLKSGFAYMSATEKGNKTKEQILAKQIRNQKSVTTSALNAASSLGMSTDATNDMFMSWHTQLGMSANELANMGRSMKQIALSTGLSGANLEEAMKSADSIMKRMRDTGSLTDTAAANVMGMMADAQKLGIKDTMDPLLKAMSGGNAIFEATGSTERILNAMMTGRGAAGRPGETFNSIRSGDILKDKEMAKNARENMSVRARGILSGSGIEKFGFDPATMDLSNITKAMKSMDSATKALVMSKFESQLVDVGTFERTNELLLNAEKTDEEKLKSLSDKIAEATARGAGGSDATKALKRQESELETGNIQQMFGKIADQMKEGKSEKVAKQDAQKELEGTFGKDRTKELLGDFGKASNKLVGSLQERAKLAKLDLNKLLGARGSSEKEIRAALTSGTSDQRETASQVLNEVMAEIGAQESANADPIGAIARDVVLIQNDLRRMVDEAFFSSDLLVQVVFWTTKIATLAGLAVGLLQYLPNILSFFGSGGLTAALSRARTAGTAALSGARTAGTAALAGARTAGTAALAGGRAALTSAPAARTALAGAGPMIGNVMSRALGPLILALGAVKGVIEADTAGRTKLEGGILGALTGGAGTGSFMSSTIGLEKGGVADKSLGVAGGAAWGAAAGAAIGVWFGGIGAGPGALIGAIVGAAAELVKIITEGTTIIADIFSPIQELLSGVWKAIKGVWDIIAGLFTLDFGRLFGGLYDIVDGIIGGIIRIVYSFFAKTIPGLVRLIYKIIKSLVLGIKSIFVDFIPWIGGAIMSGLSWLGGSILSGLKSVFVTFPTWLGGSILSGLKSVFVTFPSWLGGLLISGLKSVFVTFPSWLGGLLIEGLKAVFVTFPSWIGGLIAGAFSWVGNIGSWIKDGLASLTDNEWVGPIFSVLSESFNALYEGWMEVYKPLKDAFNEIYQIFADIGSFWSDVMNNMYQELKDIIDPIASFFSGIYTAIASFFSGIYTAIFGESGNWTFLGVAISGLQIAVHVLAQGISFLLKPIVWFAKILGFLLKVVGGVIQAIATFVTGIMQVIKGFLTFDGNAIMEGLTKAFVGAPMVIYNMFMAGVNSIAEALKKLPSWLLNILGAALLDFPMWLGGKMMDGLQAVFVDFPTWLFENITTGLEGLGDWIYDNTIGAIMNKIPDWVKNLVGGAASVISDPIGAVKSGASKVGGMAKDAVVGAGNMAYDAGAAVLDWVNPFNYFQEGTKNVKQPGLAVLHEGEMVVPKEEAKAITAVGNGDYLKTASSSVANRGAFESGQGREATDTGWLQKSAELMNGTILGGVVTAIGDYLKAGSSSAANKGAVTAVGNGDYLKAGSSSVANRGAFESGQGREATDTGWLQKSAELMNGTLIGGALSSVDQIIRNGMAMLGAGGTDEKSIQQQMMNGTLLSGGSEIEDDDGGYYELIEVSERLIEALYSTADSSTGSTTRGGIGLGLFDPVNIFDAMQGGVGTMISTFATPLRAIESIFTNDGPIKSIESMFVKGPDSIFNKLSSAFSNKSNNEKSDTSVADAGKSMYYSDITEGIMKSPLGGMVQALMQTPVGQGISELLGSKGQVSSNSIDYSDSTKGQVSTMYGTGKTSEDRVAQEKYGTMMSGTKIPGMEGIESYLAEEQNMMKVMIQYLSKIENNTKKATSVNTNVVGSTTKGLPSNAGKKMRRISQEQSSGEWDLTFGDYSPSANTTH